MPRVRTFHGPWHEEGEAAEKVEGEGTNKGGRIRTALKFEIRRQVERMDLARSRRIVVLSAYSAKLLEKMGVGSERIRLVPGGADPARFPIKNDKSAIRTRLGLPVEAKILLCVRRLIARMGVRNLIEAMAPVAARYPEVLLLIGGTGPEKESLQLAVGRLQLERNVRLLGFVPDADLPAYYQAADLFVLPTASLEGFGLVTVEALSSGTPVLGTPVGATPEILEPLDSRLLTRDATAQGIADGILGFLSEGWASALTPERLHEYVGSRFTWEKHTEGVLDVYGEVLGGQ